MKAYRAGPKWVVSGIPDELFAHIPGIKYVNDGQYSMHSDAFAVLQARLKKPALTPPQRPVLESDGVLRDYQLEGIGFLVSQLKAEGGALLADDMGLGKTVQTIRAWESLGRIPLLVCCPASVRLTWAEQFAKWATVKPVVVTTGNEAASILAHLSLPVREGGPEVVICSYDLAPKLNANWAPQMLVMDEAHLLAGRGAKRSRGLLEIGTACNYRLALTGTPMWSRPRDLWMLLRILFPNYRFGNANDFDFAYCGASINQWGGKENKGATRSEELQSRLRWVSLRRTKQEVAKDLPPLTRVTRWLPPSKEASRARDAFVLRQMSLSDALAATLKSKMDEAVTLAHELKQFLLISWQKEHVYALHQRLNEEGTPCEVITGDLSHVQRQAAIKRAVANKHGLVATIDSTNAGVDGIQYVASNGIFHALDYVPIKMAQTEARLHRIGQVNPVQWTYLAQQDSVDAMVIETIVEKLGQWSGVMKADNISAMAGAFTDADAAASADEALRQIYESLQ